MAASMRVTPLIGTIVDQNPLLGAVNPAFSIPGKFKTGSQYLGLNMDLLSKHILMIGGTGCGKSNVMYHMVSAIKKKLTAKDVLIIFDTKGDFYSLFGTHQDLMIGNSPFYSNRSQKWNFFKEVFADGQSPRTIEMNVNELSWSIFRESIEKSKDPFFPNAARELFATIIKYIVDMGIADRDYANKYFSNSEIKRAFDESTILDIRDALISDSSYSSVLSYIGDGENGQALGVYAEMTSALKKIFTGVFADVGGFSMREFVRNKGGRTLFIEYDLAIGNVLSPIYSLLIDLALKEALGRSKEDGNVYIICDEFRLLPYLQHIENAVNFGRSLGVKIIAGIQSINQLYQSYGEYGGKNVLSGFSTLFAFKPNDAFTRDYISGYFGKNIVLEKFEDSKLQAREERQPGHVVEDWDLGNLQVGEAIIGFPFSHPFKFQFDLFRR